MPKPRPGKGALTVVGTGIKLAGQVTLEALSCIEEAEKLFYLVPDPIEELWIRERNPTAENLADCYVEGEPRHRAYRRMVQRIVASVRGGRDVVAAFYGHPGVFADPPHAAIRRARREGYPARMLAGVSAEDCLFAELGVDPGARGCQSYEASDFLFRRPRFEPTSMLVLWQIGVIGEDGVPEKTNMDGLRRLTTVLKRFYGAEHRVTVYEASLYPVCESMAKRVTLSRLTKIEVPPMATLYVPPCAARERT